MLTGHLLADPGFELLTGRGRPLSAGLAGRLPDEVRASAQWWEHHIVEVLTGLPPDAPAGSAPHPDYFYSDGTHLRPLGAEFYSAVITQALAG